MTIAPLSALLTLLPDAAELSVADLPRSLAFYQTVLGFSVLSRTVTRAELGVAGAKQPLLILHALERPAAPATRATGLYHLALLLPSRADLGRLLRHVAGLNVPIGASDHLVSEAIYLTDPDGHGIEVYRDRPRSEWPYEAGPRGRQVKMATDPLDVQGVLGSAGNTVWSGLPAATRLGHLHLKVSDQQAASQFYQALGFELMTEFPGASFLAVGGYHHHLGFNVWESRGASPPAANTPALRLARFTLEAAEFPALLARLEAAQMSVQASADQTTNDWAELSDPSGNRLRFSRR
ncbi:VOC family protein [Deinococcus rubellus]|uniref:VOC family protein n=1 Tax=Deinococcus rubellus TaxID=1889240 RepID=A0ABY5YGN3_9DEIO|nr:VOC family protein [Deinococcus rubellus]UWX63444.1 VOC family protein [Deinococcus rubellus]